MEQSEQLAFPDYENMDEVWLPVVGYEGWYEVSSFGNIRSLDRVIKYSNGRKIFTKGVIMKQATLKLGYLRVQLSKNNKISHASVHRIVAIAFIPNPNHYEQVNHLERDRTDNRVWKLEWCNSSMNQRHSYSFGDRKKSRAMKGVYGDKHPVSVPVIQLTMEGKEVAKHVSLEAAILATCAKKSNISHCLKGRRKSAGGFKWKLDLVKL